MIIVDYGLARKLNTHRAARSCTFRRWNAWSDGTISLGPSYSINDRATRVHVIPCGFTLGNVARCVWRTRCTFPCLLPLRASLLPFCLSSSIGGKKKKKKKNTPVSTLPVFFNFFPFSSFLGGNLEIWKNLHTKILASVVSIVIGLTVDRIKRIVNFGIKIHYGVYYGEK